MSLPVPKTSGFAGESALCPLRRAHRACKVCGSPFSTSAAIRAGVTKSSRLIRGQLDLCLASKNRVIMPAKSQMLSAQHVHSDARRVRHLFCINRESVDPRFCFSPDLPFAYGHHPNVRTFKISTWLDNSTERRMSPFQDLRRLIDREKAPQVGHGITATTGPRSASPFTEDLPRLKQGSLPLAG